MGSWCWRRLGAVLSVGFFLVLGWPTGALAHAELVKSAPAANTRLEAAPAQVQLWFSEEPEPRLSSIQVLDEQGRRADDGQPESTGDPLSLTEKLHPDVGPGVYTVSWRATAADDGHLSGGTFVFEVQAGAQPLGGDRASDVSGTAASSIAASSSPVEGAWAALVKWVGYIAAAGLLGCVCFPSLVLEPAALPAASSSLADHLRRLARRCGWAARIFAGLGIITAALALELQAAIDGSLSRLLDTGLGQTLAVRVLVSAAALCILCLTLPQLTVPTPHRSLGAAAASDVFLGQTSRSRWPAVQILALGLVLAEMFTFSLTSHAAAAPRMASVAIVMDWLHLAAAGLWAGGLLALCTALLPEAGAFRPRAAKDGSSETTVLFQAVVQQFSKTALLSTGVVALTGMFAAVHRFETLEQVIASQLGQMLLIKLAIFAVALGLAAAHRFVLMPALEASEGRPAVALRHIFGKTLLTEAVLALGVLAASAVLTGLPPVIHTASGL